MPASVSELPENTTTSGVALAPPPITEQQLRTFHISGRGINHASPRGSLHPETVQNLPPLTRLESEYPVYVSPQFELTPFAKLLDGKVENPDLIIHAFRSAIGDKDLVSVAEIIRPALATLGDLSAADAKKLNKAIPQDGWLVPFTANALPLLYAATVTVSRRDARARFLENLARHSERLKELLRLDDSHSPTGASAESLAAAMGSEAFCFDTNALADAFRRKTNATQPMDKRRRERVEGILFTLTNAISEMKREPAVWIFHSATAPASAAAFGGELRQCGDSFEDALEFCDERLARLGRYLRAMRAARLEADSDFDPAIHEEWLQRFDWQSAEPQELAALPAFVVLEPAEWVARTSFAAFGRMLRSGRPVQVLVPYHGLHCHDQDDDLTGFMPDFGYLSIAHREAFVLQSSLAQMDHLKAGLSAMAASQRPAVAVVSVPPAREAERDEARAWLETSLLYLSRSFPLYRYDPDRGDSWMDRFELSQPIASALTTAHVVAVSDEFRQHFRIIRADSWNDAQMELAEYLERYRQTPPLAIPFLWVTDEHGERQRAVVTRELVHLIRDRQKACRIFEELAGIGNSWVEAAVTKTRAESQEAARREGATAAIHQVVAMLRNGESITAAIALPPPNEHIAATTTTPAPAAPAEAEASEDPYIDTFLCTSCNDCMKVNPMVFGYDANKQAYIANARAGTFADLVKAAEGCPARCIHPGTPRPEDTTATPAMRAKAAKFQ